MKRKKYGNKRNMYYIIGLGNPGKEYETTRHNTGRIVLGDLVKIKEMKFDKKLNALITDLKFEKDKAQIIFPETYMNNSGLSLKPIINKILKKKMAKNLIVVHDDLDLFLGKFKISFGSGSAGHKGVESIIRNIKTKDFIRIRVGISPSTPKGKIKKPESKQVIKYITGKFKPKEFHLIKKNLKKITLALKTIVNKGF